MLSLCTALRLRFEVFDYLSALRMACILCTSLDLYTGFGRLESARVLWGSALNFAVQLLHDTAIGATALEPSPHRGRGERLRH